MHEHVKAAVPVILEATKRLVTLTKVLESEPIDKCIDEITDAIWLIYGRPLTQNEDNAKFFDAMVSFQAGKAGLDQCVQIMDEFAESLTRKDDEDIER